MDNWKIYIIAMEGSREEGQVKLLGVGYSAFVVRVCIALGLKGIHSQFIEEDI